MNKGYNTLGHMIMLILAGYSSYEFPMSYGSLKVKLNELYRMLPAHNTLICTVKDMSTLFGMNWGILYKIKK